MKKTIVFLMLGVLLLSIVACDEDSKPNQPPVLVTAANPTSGVAPLTVNFTATAEDPDGTVVLYSWNFGDGLGTSVQQNPSYVYNTAGTYMATCTVTDNGKQPLTTTATVVITVYQSKIPTLSTISPTWNVIHMPEFILTVTGTDFFPQSKIVFDSKEMATTYISSTQLSCKIEPDDTVLSLFLKSDGSLDLQADQYAGVLVRNPGTGGGDSATLQFTIRPNQLFDQPVVVSPRSERYSWYYMTVHKGKNLYVTYPDTTDETYPQDLELIRASKDSGQTWGDAHQMPIMDKQWNNTVVAGNDGVLYFQDEEYLYKSFDDGETLVGPIWISGGTPDGSCYEYWNQDYNLKMLSDGTLYSAWMESKIEVCVSDGEYYGGWILHLTSKDGGSTWSGPTKVPSYVNLGPNYYFPSLWVTASGRLHFFFSSGYSDPFYASGYAHMTSVNGGQSWSTPVDIISLTNLFIMPAVGDDDNLYVPNKTAGASSQQIAVKYWLEGYPAPSVTPDAVSLALSQTVKTMAVCVDSAGNINLFYTYGPDEGGYAVYYQRSFDRGVTWTTSKRISHLTHINAANSVLCDAAGNLYVIWAKIFPPYPIYFSSSERNQ